MGDTYVQAYFHLVFAVQNRKALIQKSWKERLEKYITGIVQNNGHKLISIGAERDHIHIFIGYNLNQKIPDLVEKIKTSSNQFIKTERLSYHPFSWQNGYGAFTHSHSNLKTVANYVENQEEHHKKTSFREEYIRMLEDFEVAYKPKYLFEFFDDIEEGE
jgi:REP element-mobilizing transposase RayT